VRVIVYVFLLLQ